MWQSWFNVIAGIWMILCGFIPGLRTPVSMIVPGAVALVFGYWSAADKKEWKGALNGTIGVWLLLSSIWFGLYVPWNFLVFGVALTLIALWNISEHSNPTHHVTANA